TRALLLIVAETVAVETPASLATSLIVGMEWTRFRRVGRRRPLRARARIMRGAATCPGWRFHQTIRRPPLAGDDQRVACPANRACRPPVLRLSRPRRRYRRLPRNDRGGDV